MRHCLYCVFICSLLLGCTEAKLESLKIENVSMFGDKTLDSLAYEGKTLRQLLKDEHISIIYIVNNECSECIYKYIDFQNEMSQSFPAMSKIYIVEGCDRTAFRYYVKEHHVETSANSVIIEDTLDIFLMTEKYVGAPHLFVAKKDSLIHVMSDPFKDEKARDAFINFIQRNSN